MLVGVDCVMNVTCVYVNVLGRVCMYIYMMCLP